MKKIQFVLLVFSFVLSACAGAQAAPVTYTENEVQATLQAREIAELREEIDDLKNAPNREVTEAPAAQETEAPATEEPSSTEAPAAEEAAETEAPADEREFEMTVAGADFFALGVEDLDSGWMRVREAGNRDYCAWSNQFKMEISNGLAAQIPHCWELRLTGTGTAKFTFRPDSEGYDTSDTLKSGLAFWPSGNNGSYRVTRNGETTDWIPLTTGPEGVRFDKDGGEVVIEFKLENGYMAMPLGEIRNNVQPKY